MTAFPDAPAAARRIRYAVLAGAVCTGLAAALTGCSAEDPDAGTNGVGKLSAQKIESKARGAVSAADSVRLSGTIVSGGKTYQLDMLLKGAGGSGRVSTEAAGSFELLRVEKDLYLKADAAFWKDQGKKGEKAELGDDKSAAAGKLDDKYVKVPVGDPAYKQLSGFTDMELLLDDLIVLHGELSKEDRGEVGGSRTIRLAGGGGSGGTLDVSLEGKPFPLRFQRAGDAGELRFADWNKDFDLLPPGKGDIVDYGEKIATTG
ncbi:MULTISPECIES: hypothetical protein [Streptomyces]|uniref:Lipoprotein n=1 Tax=Streptomyces lycii TaxID=2654337 RepID=A0ABQ7FRG5_9ACTN|nr:MULTISPECIES: hypothetical protein [Streptomyces]KAF4410344.1 hypothetical protein GCU69_04305 [Streptomyces lycii]PGH52389.1 hypothetical protein CRI70_01595 [Streptomyces sp. Ru87]